MTRTLTTTEAAHGEGSGWDQTYRDLGYEWCRPCREWHRPPECAIDEEGRPLDWEGRPWD